MKIGIASPIEVFSLKHHLKNLTEKDEKLGLGGIAVNILINGLIEEGHQVTVFTLDHPITEKYILKGDHLKIVFGPFRKWTYKTLDFCYQERKRIKEYILEEKDNLDIVHAHWSYDFAIGTIKANIPSLITFRDHSQTILKLNKHPYRLSRLLMDLWVRRNGQNFSFNSEYLKEMIGVEGIVIPNPISDDLIEESRIFPVGVFKICFIANGWDYRKNPEAAIEAFHILLKEVPNVELHLIGDGFEEDTENYNNCKEKGLIKNVVFRGKIHHPILMKEFKNFNLMLHTAREESFGNNLIEAMAKGMPVIGGVTSGAVPWVMDYGRSGILVDVENPIEIAEKMKELLTNRDMYEELSKNGIENVKNRFKQSVVTKCYLKEYQRIINLEK